MVILVLFTIPFLSALFALSAQRQIAQHTLNDQPFDAPFYRGIVCVVAFYIPVLSYFFQSAPDWSLAYMVEPGRLPRTFGAVLISLAFSGFFFFYLATQSLLRARRPLTAWLVTVQLGVAALIFGIVFLPELTHKGDYYAFHTGTAATLSLANGLTEAGVGVLLLLAPACIILLWNHREGSSFPPLEFEDSKW